MDPPVSEPSATGANPAATAAAEPPEEPPGTRLVSWGFRVGPKAELSVDEPMANSSILVLPTMTAPASPNRVTTVASYGGRQPSRIRDEQVVLQRHRHPGQQARVLPRRHQLVDNGRLRTSGITGNEVERVDLAIVGVDGSQIVVEDFDRAGFPIAYEI